MSIRMKLTFKLIDRSDLLTIGDIYNYYVLNTTVTFRRDPVGLDELKRMYRLDDGRFRTYLINDGTETAGYCGYGPYKLHEGYERTAGIFIYLRPDKIARGIGTMALRYLERVAREHGISVLLAYITAGNVNSDKLLKKQGYEQVAHFKRIGEKFNKTLDVTFYQKEL